MKILKNLKLITFEESMTGEIIEVPDVVQDDGWLSEIGCGCGCGCGCSSCC